MSAVLLLSGCAAVTCRPASIEVAKKETRPRLESRVEGVRTSETGQVVERRRDEIVTDHWVQDTQGQWYRVGEQAWREAKHGDALSVCR